MSLTRNKNENWLLVEWSSGDRDVVYVRSVLSPVNNELKIGDVLTVNRRGEPQKGTLVARARERNELDALHKSAAAGPSMKNGEELDDFSASGSSWAPSDDGALSGDSDKETNNKKMKLELFKRQYVNRRSSKRILTPSHRANAIIPKAMQETKNNSRKRPHNDSINVSIKKSLPDSTRRHKASINKTSPQNVTIDVTELESIRNGFHMLFKMIEDLKQSTMPSYSFREEQHILQPKEHFSTVKQVETVIEVAEEDNENDDYLNEEFNRSDDNVLITNKYDKTYIPTVKKHTVSDAGAKEWIPIGSGKTLIHVDQFRKVNWKSYTIATRSLLLAVFPRRILATHSLTGKRSPAFQNKPAKMCLDPKIISDVIMEIMDRFDVKENLVRSIITTKCADECKMWKARTMKKKSKSVKNVVNVATVEDNFEEQMI